MADVTHQWYDSEPGVDTIRIYVENHSNRCREFFIWISFDFLKSRFPRVRALLLEDPLIYETCPLEESASHHVVDARSQFMNQHRDSKVRL